ncbi:MAG: tetratricopeptide repeat protein [Methanomicrobiales archaeon]|nr:tetratricopeptide repeat protein [Methanomicrobiales archaeon]
MQNQIRAWLAVLILFAISICVVGSADNLLAIDYYNKGVDLAYEGKYSEALVSIDRALEENAQFTLALVTKAGILNALGRYPEAIDAADQALSLDPGQAAAWNNKAFALNQQDRYSEGLAAADTAVSLDPDLVEGWVNKGSSLIGLERYEEALAASNEALARDPGSAEAEKNREISSRALSPSPTAAAFPIIWPVAAVFLAGAILGGVAIRKRE